MILCIYFFNGTGKVFSDQNKNPLSPAVQFAKVSREPNQLKYMEYLEKDQIVLHGCMSIFNPLIS